ncbi:MAG: DUF3467 domain-containing protein [Nitrospirota bacterium]
MADKPKPAQPSLTFEIRPDIEGGVYSNVASIVHNANEFIFDFAAALPGKEAATVRARIITNPIHAKQFLAALAENISAYERTFGEIQAPVPAQVAKITQTVH